MVYSVIEVFHFPIDSLLIVLSTVESQVLKSSTVIVEMPISASSSVFASCILKLSVECMCVFNFHNLPRRLTF